MFDEFDKYISAFAMEDISFDCITAYVEIFYIH